MNFLYAFLLFCFEFFKDFLGGVDELLAIGYELVAVCCVEGDRWSLLNIIVIIIVIIVIIICVGIHIGVWIDEPIIGIIPAILVKIVVVVCIALVVSIVIPVLILFNEGEVLSQYILRLYYDVDY